MACLSPSPSGRRLSELLEEQQEPFSLDLHLLEKGCSPTLLDGYDAAATVCWPAAGADGAAAVVLRRLTSKKSGGNGKAPKANNKKPATGGGGLLQLLLSKILRGRAAAYRKPAALQCSESFKLAAVAPSPCADPVPGHHLVEEPQHAAACCDCSDDSDCDDEKQQLSPVSVLEQHPFETSPVHGHGKLSPSKNAMDVFRDLLDAAYSPALLNHLLARTDDLLRDTHAAASSFSDDDDDDGCYGYRTSPKHCRDDESAAAYWDAHRAELARVSELVACEVPASSRVSPGDVRPERQDVGAEVAAAVLESLVRELVVDLAGWC